MSAPGRSRARRATPEPPLLDDFELVSGQAMVVPAAIEVDDRVEPRHCRRLLRGPGDQADIALSGMEEQVRPVSSDCIGSESHTSPVVDDAPPCRARPQTPVANS